MRFSQARVGGGAQPPPTPGAGDPKPLQGHERVRGKEDRCADEVGGAGWSVCVWVGCHCLAKMLPMNFTTFGRSKIKRERRRRNEGQMHVL